MNHRSSSSLVQGFAAAALTLVFAASARAQEIHLDELGHDYGSAEAPVKVIELSDFSCTYCRRFHLDTYETLVDEYVDTGKVQWKYVTFVSGQFPNSMEASLVAECTADQGHFAAIRDGLFASQPEWRPEDDPMPVLLELAEDIGANREALEACVADGRVDQRIEDGRKFGYLSGVRGTPTFIVDGFPMMGALPIEFIREVFDRRLAAHAKGGLQPR